MDDRYALQNHKWERKKNFSGVVPSIWEGDSRVVDIEKVGGG